jgi:hypothetical protein
MIPAIQKLTQAEKWLAEVKQPEIPTEWDFGIADKEFDKNIRNWRRLTGDVMSQLWVFYNKLAVGHRRKSSPNGEQLPTWAKWLESKSKRN